MMGMHYSEETLSANSQIARELGLGCVATALESSFQHAWQKILAGEAAHEKSPA
jgi:hypothetical protein